MKRLILMGGSPWLDGECGKDFVTTAFRYFPKRVRVAFCIFAQPESDWQETTDRNIEMFKSHEQSKSLEFKTMTTGNFEDVSKWADVIYLPGGSPSILMEKLAVAGDINVLWDNKVIAGSSAGADLFCEKFLYLQDRVFGAGLGWVKAVCIPHWRDDFDNYSTKDWDWAEQEALNRFPELPVLTIPEGRFIELTIK